MKNLFTLLLITLTIQVYAQCYELVWEENFDGNSIDDTKWRYQNGGWNGSNVQNCYDPANTSVSNGSLFLEARYEPGFDCFGTPKDFTSGFIQTKDRIDWTFGRFEARIKMPASNSTWPAFWMSPQDPIYGAWPQSGEIDITEIKGHDMTKSYGNAHWGNSPGDKQQDKQTYTFSPGNGADNWHVYTVEWQLGQLDFYIDGNYYGTINNFDEPNATTHPGPFDIGFYLRLNVAVGGDYLSAPWNDANNGINQLPAAMEVDWVRVYQDLGNCPPPTDCNLVSNGGFDNSFTDWSLYKYGSADGNLSLTGNGFAKIDISNAGTSSWHLALRQTGLYLENGKTYNIRLKAYADAARSCPIIISQSGGSQYAYIAQSLTTTPTVYEYQFTMNDATDADGVFNLNVGNDPTDVYVDDISISEIEIGGSCDDGDACTIDDMYDNNCDCLGTYTDADGDGYCVGNDPNDNDPCIPDVCETPCDIVENGNFANVSDGWSLYRYGSADGNLSLTGNGFAKIDISNAGTSSWHLALRQTGLYLENGMTYTIRLSAYADAPRSCPIIISQSNGTQYAYIAQSLTTTPTVYEYQFTMNDATNTNGVFNLNVGNDLTDVYVDDISINGVAIDTPCDDGDACTIDDMYDEFCQCQGIYTDVDNDGYCIADDPDDKNPCTPDICPSVCESLQNWNFDNGTNDWTAYNYGTSNASLDMMPNGDMKLDIITPGSTDWHIALRQSGFLLETGKTYQLRMEVYADAPRSGSIIISRAGGDQYAYLTQNFTASPTIYTYQFTMNDANDPAAIFNLNVGSTDIDIYVSAVSISDLSCIQASACASTLMHTGLATVNGTYRAAQTVESDAAINSNAIYKAGEQVHLKNNFSVGSNSNFSAEIEDCQ